VVHVENIINMVKIGFFEVTSSNFSSVEVCSSENGAQKWTTDLQNSQKDLKCLNIEEGNFLKTHCTLCKQLFGSNVWCKYALIFR
jgi:hypothetical protein